MIVPGEVELGEQKLCPRCKSAWPLDTDFYRRKQDAHGVRRYWHAWCIACLCEQDQQRRRRTVA